MEKLLISDCASIKCTEQQRGAVETISSDVAGIDTDNEDNGGIAGILNTIKNNKFINAVEYKF